jgi:hypothetical protein
MFYNTRTNSLIDQVPLNGYFENGTLVQGLNIADFNTQKLCGILPVKSDQPSQPQDTMENISERLVVIEEDGVNITRQWIPIPPQPVVVPESISPRQIRLWLVEHNISLSAVDAAIASIPDTLLREKTKIEWEFSPYVERNHPMINSLGLALNLTSEQIDQAFVEAAQL